MFNLHISTLLKKSACYKIVQGSVQESRLAWTNYHIHCPPQTYLLCSKTGPNESIKLHPSKFPKKQIVISLLY